MSREIHTNADDLTLLTLPSYPFSLTLKKDIHDPIRVADMIPLVSKPVASGL
jgi:hypothetical protein